VQSADPGIEGLDYAGGLKRLGNMQAAYTRVLASYAANMPGLLDKIRGFRPQDLENYRITVHGIKGASYGIGANDVGRQAEALEMAAKNNDIETILAKNDGLILQAQKLAAAISAYITSL
jgi:HPt (histidine-containing phosphotransfer) domain-containing protein